MVISTTFTPFLLINYIFKKWENNIHIYIHTILITPVIYHTTYSTYL